MVSVGYFDTYDAAKALDLSAYTDIYTLGRKKKNDGGGAHYKRYASPTPYLGFPDGKTPTANRWGLIPDGGSVNPLQAGGGGGGETDRDAIQACINFIQWWNDTTTENDTPAPPSPPSPAPPNLPIPSKDSNRSAIKLVIPANRVFVVNTGGTDPRILSIRSPITIEGEDRFTSVIMLDEQSVGTAIATGDGFDVNAGSATFKDLFHAEGDPTSPTDPTPKTIRGLTFRNLTVKGSYAKVDKDDHGAVGLFSFKNLERVQFEDMVFTRNRAVMISGDGVRGLTMRGCVLSENRRGGMIISGAADITVENNDFRWVGDDPISINGSGPQVVSPVDPWFFHYGASIRIVGNRSLGSRGLNVIGAKNVLIESNISVLGHGRAIHVGVVTDEGKGDTTTLNVIVRANIILDMLAGNVDPQFDQDGDGGHRAIDIELLNGGPGTLVSPPPPTPPNFIPGLPRGTQTVLDPTQYYYTVGQGNSAPGTGAPVPHAAGLLLEGNIIARTRPPVVTSGADHITGFNKFDDFGIGRYGGDEIGVANLQISLAAITPSEGIAISGAARGLTIRGNQIGGCDTSIYLKGWGIDAPPLGLYDVVIELNDLSDWTTAGILFANFGSQPPIQRVSILGNRANGDPFHRNQRDTVRLNQGCWADTEIGTFVNATKLGFAMIAGNQVRNVSQLIVGYSGSLHTMRDNVGYCDPYVTVFESAGVTYDTSYHATNRGIGRLIHPALGWRYVIEGCDPGVLPSYGKVSNTCPLAVAAVVTTSGTPTVTTTTPPTGFKWVEGTIVLNRSATLVPPTGSAGTARYWVSGWRRMTTGTGDALNTNWWELRTPTNPF